MTRDPLSYPINHLCKTEIFVYNVINLLYNFLKYVFMFFNLLQQNCYDWKDAKCSTGAKQFSCCFVLIFASATTDIDRSVGKLEPQACFGIEIKSTSCEMADEKLLMLYQLKVVTQYRWWANLCKTNSWLNSLFQI